MAKRPGALYLYRCCACGKQEAARGGSSFFRCLECKAKFAEPPNATRTGYDWNGKEFAHSEVFRAVAEGRLRKVTECECVDCGAPAKHYDHRDYNHPLTVEPVCRKCNRRRGPAIPKRK